MKFFDRFFVRASIWGREIADIFISFPWVTHAIYHFFPEVVQCVKMPFPASVQLEFSPHFHEPGAPDQTRIGCRIDQSADQCSVTVSGPVTGQPPPPGPAGRFEELWRHDVIEVFLLGAGERYLELELGPHGHYWLLMLHGCRNIVSEFEPLGHTWRCGEDRWEVCVRIPCAVLPAGLCAFNVTTILGPQRFHGSYVPLPGDKPDFHQLDCFHFPG